MPAPLPSGSSFPADVNEPLSFPVTVALPPWLFDHHFDGRAIFPAVELMCLLAQTVQQAEPQANVREMTAASFNRLLALPPGQAQMTVIIELSREGGGIRAQLFSRQQFKAITRLVQHGEAHFASDSMVATGTASPAVDITSKDCCCTIGAEQIYRELVPFGPAYQTLHGEVTLKGTMAWGTLRAPNFTHETKPLGSPFPLDGAMHAACVHGQRQADFVPFPVGFAARIIHRPTEPGQQYQTCAALQTWSSQELVYDLVIRDMENRRCETICGLRMRDVTGGRIKPPGWFKTLGKREPVM